MKLPRREFLHLVAGVAALPVAPRLARAQAYPSRPVRIIVAFPAGGPTDIVARVAGQWLSERFPQQFFVENRPGAGGNIGTEAVVRAPADGHTLLQVGAYAVINAAFYEKLSFNILRDIVPVARLVGLPLVMIVNPAVPATTVPEFIAYAKANAGKINMASSGNGATPHVAGELFKMMADVNMIHVPYRGSAPALTDLLGGQIQVMFDFIASAIQHIRSGKLRALAVTTTMRSDALPDVPTVGEFVRGYEASGWFGLGAPRNTSADIIQKLNQEMNAGLADAKIKARFADLGSTVLPGSPAEFGKLIADETEKWAKVVKFAGIKPE
jgi:tripartite-type tricarboxylate transporter receptor subunit TctC